MRDPEIQDFFAKKIERARVRAKEQESERKRGRDEKQSHSECLN